MQKLYRDCNVKQLPRLSPGQSVAVQDPISKNWTPSVVHHEASTPRSYVVSSQAGRSVQRNRAHIRELPQQPSAVPPPTVNQPPAATVQQPRPIPASPAKSQVKSTSPQ